MTRFSLALCAVFILACTGAAESPPEAPAPAAPSAAAPAPAAPAPAEPAPSEPEPWQATPGNRCNVGAYVVDPDPKGLNVRADPGMGGEKLGALPTHTMVTLEDDQKGWVRVTDPEAFDYDGDLPEGWVAAKLLGTDLKTPNDYGPDMKPMWYRNQSAAAPLVEIDITPVPELKVLGCAGRRLKVELTYPSKKPLVGWLPPESHCPNPMTNCS